MAKFNSEDPRITFARIVLKVDGTETFMKSIQYGDSVEFSEVEGNSRMSAGTTDGNYKTDEGTLELYADDFAELMEQFGDGFYAKIFTVSVAYEKVGSSKLTQDELVSCRFTKRSANDQSGTEGLTRSLSYKPWFIKWNGKNPLKKMPAGVK